MQISPAILRTVPALANPVRYISNMTTKASSSVPLAPTNIEEDVWSYPRPPALQRTPNRLQVIWYADGIETVIADTTEAYRVLETSHPPTYYLPADAIHLPIEPTSKRTFCEWKGQATYYLIHLPDHKLIANRIWSYHRPIAGFKPLQNYLSFYASAGDKAALGGEWRCFVDGEQVVPQEGDFYGGWVTNLIKGKMKGGPGTWGW